VIFVDTSFWVALVSGRDDRHREATALLTAHGHSRLVTSSLVRGETWTFLRRRTGHATAVAYLDHLDRSGLCDVRDISPEIDRRALGWLRQHDEREYSHVDATSFVLMRTLKMRDALAFDGDFTTAGFVELRL
jgi:predicted nucleic acid-binding protein